jgi:cysteine sulfinate desulfinase/cysteine desulfurase-like protein
VNRKVVDLTTLYNIYKGTRVFFSTDFAQLAGKLSMPPHSGEQELLTIDQVFHPFPLKI